MAVMHLESVVLHGVPVAGDVVTGMVRLGSNQASGRLPAILSQSRHPSQRFPLAGYEPAWRRFFADRPGKDSAEARAGRPWSRASVLNRQGRSKHAARTIICRWSPLAGGTSPTATWGFGLSTAKRPGECRARRAADL